MIRIIGTSHIAKESVSLVKSAIDEWQPDIVAVELDKQRLNALLNPRKEMFSWYGIRKIGIKGAAFAVIASYASKKLGRMVGMEPGADMLTAVKLAKEKGLKVALIDRDISITLNRFSKTLSWKERFNFLADIFNSIFLRKREMKRLGIEHIDLSKVPEKEIIEKMVEQLKARYPNVYKVLVTERNNAMASNLLRVQNDFPGKKILAVVGAGHEKGLKMLLSGTRYHITVNNQ